MNLTSGIERIAQLNLEIGGPMAESLIPGIEGQNASGNIAQTRSNKERVPSVSMLRGSLKLGSSHDRA